jgi:hypothetical protein
MMATSRNVRDLLNRLAAEEARFLAADFLAPMLGAGVVSVRIAGIVCRLRVEDNFSGWGVFRPTDTATARLVRPATLAERAGYLEALPLRRLILCRAERRRWLAWPAHNADQRFADATLVPVRFVDEAQLFDIVAARWDGVQCWFEALDERADPSAAVYLRESLRHMTPPEQIRRRGLTAEQRTAYAVAHALRMEAERDRTEERLRAALAHAGGELTGYLERQDSYRVEFQIDGQRHVSLVAKDDLSIQLAGICLSGEDRHFDLQSLVGVLREAHSEGVLPD